MRILKKIKVNPIAIKEKLLLWAENFREVAYLNSNNYPQQYSSYDLIVAVDAFTSLKTDYLNAFDDLKQYQQQTNDWLFGYLAYDLKNDIESLNSKNHDGLNFSDLFFFQPKKIFFLRGNELEIAYLNMCDDEIDSDLEEILEKRKTKNETQKSEIIIQQRVSKEHYIKKVNQMLTHIHRGDLYEANFCMEFYAKNGKIIPSEIFQELNKISEPPFACFFKNHIHYLLCASPERYIRKENQKVISQPIKGTSKRFEDLILDTNSKTELEQNPKERSENIMIVDLVRNDLAQTATKGSVQVEELCKIYSFKQVHQMISTVISEVKSTTNPVDIIKNTFPMGSMTGAPKISAMRIIEELEETKRGLYSGAVGYFTPSGNFDFNVVIRSILYNSNTHYLSFSVGSAITALSDPEQEYEECLLKAKAMREVLS
ncbi:anthranilate synthase component I family protein [Flavobacterium columnare]|uniref:Para-aminobenzoate synthase component I n=1 Tax=Flavobacterium columnare (strain ATCC 49512 / CIP 103533 / TG 44/87) TaxID=1041826 RepID=G8XB75_FLACA|nr:anthranilate synthase component I family protein [Flavobacterium columnare]AEW86043.1 Para-aminobenzoate synthase component I [Flavobacterium columnare ATCC 49512]OOB82606.1 aminodeoxychorismate synthase component I [Flavobacterium columnare]PTD16167.1 anthranilate synthase component I family protein [Flavobacterium columnare]QOG88642.1 anthranilate synthase component I family protein [Flavobacterium columnare]QOG91301.1 anthranilate synthase component I family protein [Flavobacterium colum